jgi:hypothetical protein
VATIDDVIARMQAIQDSLADGDGVRAFNTVYQQVTVALKDKLGTNFFGDDQLVEQLDVIFAGRFFAAVDADAAGQQVGSAWRPLFALRADKRVHAVQFVVAGMNAHINFDLPLAVVSTCEAANTEPDAGSVFADYQKVNVVLESIESEVRQSLLQDLEQQLGHPLEPLQHLISSWSIGSAREAAWVRAKVLWHLRDIQLLFDQIVNVSASTVGMTSQQLLTPLLPLDG